MFVSYVEPSGKLKTERWKNWNLKIKLHFYLVRYNLFIICKLITNKKERMKNT